MAGFINGVKVPFVPITKKDSVIPNRTKVAGDSFSNVFQKELNKLKISAHATKRLESRNINLNDADIAKLNDAVGKAEAKGAHDSLVMMNNTAFIVNIPNRTVITALPVGKGEENVFTNIDSVVFAT